MLRSFSFPSIIHGRFITTVVTTNHAFIALWIHAAHSEMNNNAHPLILGLHISLATGNRVATLQLCFDQYCLIYHVHIDNNPFPESLRHFLLNNYFFGFIEKPHLRILEAHAQLDPGTVRYMRLGVLAANVYRRPCLKGAGLCALAAIVLRKLIRRPAVPRRWDDRTLSQNQTMHATMSPYLSLQIALILLFNNAVKKLAEEDLGKVEYFRILDEVIRVTVTSRQSVIENWIAERQQEVGQAESYVGFDAELVVVNDQARVGTVQFCVGWQCLVIQVQRMSRFFRYMPRLERFLLHDNNIFTGVDDVERKMRMFVGVLRIGDLGVVRGADVRTYMLQYWLREAGHRQLAAEELRGDLEMPEAVEDDWDRRFMLSDHQVFTAIIHVIVPFIIANRVNPL